MAIRAYLNTLPPVQRTSARNELTWPLNYRVLMRGWDWMYFDARHLQPDPNKSAEWNRGAYLVEGAGHCGACHTPKNIAGADESEQQAARRRIAELVRAQDRRQHARRHRAWGIDDIVEYLKTGRNRFSGAAGLMAEVVTNSTSKLPKEDLHAIAVYLKDLDGGNATTASKPDKNVMTAGAAIFADSCSACHQADGNGVPRCSRRSSTTPTCSRTTRPPSSASSSRAPDRATDARPTRSRCRLSTGS